jgi:hypothetical protein
MFALHTRADAGVESPASDLLAFFSFVFIISRFIHPHRASEVFIFRLTLTSTSSTTTLAQFRGGA